MARISGVDARWVTDEEQAELLRDMTGERTGWLRVGPRGYCMPSTYLPSAQHLSNFAVRPTDTWVITFPRSGTTLTQELVWLVANGFDFEAAAATPLVERFPFLEYHLFMHPETKEMFKKENCDSLEKQELIERLARPGYLALDEMPQDRPRFIKTHLPFSLLPAEILKSKVIYVARNPKDAAVSLYHLLRLMRTSGYQGDFPKFWDYFERALVPWAPFFDHIEEGLQLMHHPNVLFLLYEDMVSDMAEAVRKVAGFLGRDTSDQAVSRLASHLDIANFRNNPSVNFDILKGLGIQLSGEQAFIRNGKSGGRQVEMTEELGLRADAWVAAECCKRGISLPEAWRPVVPAPALEPPARPQSVLQAQVC